QGKLDAPNRAYQEYLKAHEKWKAKRDMIEGNVEDVESIRGLEQAIASLAEIPGRIEESRRVLESIARSIHEEKLAQASVLRELYAAVQGFIDTHELAKERLKLEFRAE